MSFPKDTVSHGWRWVESDLRRGEAETRGPTCLLDDRCSVVDMGA
jgi:hypothetical protein